MMKETRAPARPCRFHRGPRGLPVWFWLLLLCGGTVFTARATIQFDLFVGYDETVHEGSWFPVACEVLNDGPTFKGVFELTNESAGRNQVRRVVVELPTNTRKRFVIPVFASAGRYGSWSARLLDERGKVRAERLNVRPRDKSWDSVLLGAIPRTFAGMPSYPDLKNKQDEFQPKVSRLQVDYFPDNPIALEGLDALYLNSEKALDLKAPQIAALLAWLYGGGHLIMSVEQPADINGTPWLRNLVPCELTGISTVKPQNEIQSWLQFTQPHETLSTKQKSIRRPGNLPPAPLMPRGGPNPPSNPYINLQPDTSFDAADLPVASGTVLDGQTILKVQNKPLVVQARRGRGQITLLTFSPEREPFRSWKHKTWFWVKLTEISSEWLMSPDFNRYGGFSIDGVMGAMIDSRQVRKLPVTWLLLLLVVYLVVIGPLDQFWLKKINRQMLTWITFPAYVALFSGLIYFIGYKLRAGETEWNELHLVDILPRGEQAELRGRTYASVYSPVNAKYELVSDQPHATLRGEFQGTWGGGQESSRASVEQQGRGFRADIYVPVWTSQLFVSDWMQPAETPLRGRLVAQGGKFQLEIENNLNRKLTDARLVMQGKIFNLGDLAANQKKNITLDPSREGTALTQFIEQYRFQFFAAVQRRRQALGSGRNEWLEKSPANAIAASFVSQLDDTRNNNSQFFIAPSGFDMTPLVEKGDAIVFAWAAGYAPAAPINRFSTRRSQRDTLLRLAIPLANN